MQNFKSFQYSIFCILHSAFFPCIFGLNLHWSLAIINKGVSDSTVLTRHERNSQEKIMQTKKEQTRRPRTVNEAAEQLLSDLLVQHLQSLSRMSENEFDSLCDHVTPYLNEEFQIWQGNVDLLDSCFRQSHAENEDPARIILNRVKSMLNNFNGFLVIT